MYVCSVDIKEMIIPVVSLPFRALLQPCLSLNLPSLPLSGEELPLLTASSRTSVLQITGENTLSSSSTHLTCEYLLSYYF